jgi:YidC/Oxa1 family membrane protein insertase
MEQQEQRNLLLALVLCFGLFMLYNFFVLDPQQKAREAAQKQAQQNAVEQVTSPAPTVRSRDEVVTAGLADGSRVAVQAPSVEGSISLQGARIDDVSLKNYYETVEDKEKKKDRKSTRLNSSHNSESRMPSSA